MSSPEPVDARTLPFPTLVVGQDGRIESTNGPFDELLPGQVGAAWLDGFPGIDRQRFEQDWSRLSRQGLPLTLYAGTLAGDREGRTYELICQPISDIETEPTRMLGVLIDVTEQSRRDAEMLALLDTAVDAILTIDEHGTIEVFNRAASELFGYTADEAVGNPVTMLMPEPHRSRHPDYLSHYMETGETRIIGVGRELEAAHKSGRSIPIYLAVSEIRHQGRRRFTGIVRDLSEQRAAREALAEQRERLAHVGRLSIMGEMTASIAHEINQPLTAIAMYAQSSLKLLKRGNADPLKLANALDKLNTQSLRAGAIIERIQRFARSQESRMERLDLNDLLRDLVKLAEGDARIHDVSISFDLAPDLPAVRGDPIQIQQVALNLIRNAIDAMQEIRCANGNALTICSRRLGSDRIEVDVIDRGPGVDDDQRDRLFRAFHTTKKEGMGMGLSICRTIIAAHAGELAYRNNDDAGATFYFTLPVADSTGAGDD